MKRTNSLHPDILHVALSRLEAQKEAIETQIAAVRRMLPAGQRVGGLLKAIANPAAPIVGTAIGGPRKRTVNPEGRKRMAAAQRKRWAAARRAAKK